MRIAEHELRQRPLPPLYASGVRYRREPRRSDGGRLEDWMTPHEVASQQTGDCEDLAVWRASELRILGERAFAKAFESTIGWHIKVVRGDGSVEDPSVKLGMRAP